MDAWMRPLGRREFLARASYAGLVTLAACSQESNESAEAAAYIPALEAQIRKSMEAAHVPGLSMATVQRGEIVWRRAFGLRDRTSGEPVHDDTAFEAASMSKPVFAYAVMKLVENGELDLDRPLTEYTSARFVADDARLDQITARQVFVMCIRAQRPRPLAWARSMPRTAHRKLGPNVQTARKASEPISMSCSGWSPR